MIGATAIHVRTAKPRAESQPQQRLRVTGLLRWERALSGYSASTISMKLIMDNGG